MDANIQGWNTESLEKLLDEKKALPPNPVRLETIEMIQNELDHRKLKQKSS